jgi:periplasmic protein TonB
MIKPLLAALAAVLLVIPSVSAQIHPSAEPVYAPGGDVSLPRVTKQVHVHYTPDAMWKKLSGTIRLKCVVSIEGTTQNVELVSGLEEQMDENAVAALKQWKFEPGQREGKPVAVRVTVDMTFTVR